MATIDLAVVDLPRERDQLELGRAVEQEMRVDGDAVATHAEPGLVDVAVRLAVGGRDDLQDVDADPVRIARELVGEGDVDVAIGRVGELGELAASDDDIATTSASSTLS